MEQATGPAIRSCVRYRGAEAAVAVRRAAPNTWALLERGALFLLVCAFWGLVIFVALTSAIR